MTDLEKALEEPLGTNQTRHVYVRWNPTRFILIETTTAENGQTGGARATFNSDGYRPVYTMPIQDET